MFVWYIKGAPRVYEPPRAHHVESVVKTHGVTPLGGNELSETSATTTTSTAIKGYGEHAQERPEQRRQVILVREIMSSPVKTVNAGDSIDTVSHLFSSKKVRHAPVIDDRGRLCGIASERDLLRKMTTLEPVLPADEDLYSAPPPPTLVRDFMKSSVLTTLPDAEIRFAARVMFQEKIGALPVVEKGGSVVGIVTRSDILRIVMNTVPLELWL